MGKYLRWVAVALSLGGVMACGATNNRRGDDVRSVDHMVPHVSTVPANKGAAVEIFVREKFAGSAAAKPVVLMVHGGVSPSTLAFDVEHEDYS